MLQNARVTAFTVSELLSKNQKWVKLPPSQGVIHLMRMHEGGEGVLSKSISLCKRGEGVKQKPTYAK